MGSMATPPATPRTPPAPGLLLGAAFGSLGTNLLVSLGPKVPLVTFSAWYLANYQDYMVSGPPTPKSPSPPLPGPCPGGPN